jgi:ribosomal protein L12E/L44/L45/RPP1/RPP2
MSHQHLTYILTDLEGKDLAEIMQAGQDKLKSCVGAVSAGPGNCSHDC